MPCRPQSNEPWSVDDCMNVVPQVYPSDVTTAMFLGTLGSREPDLQIYSIAQCSMPPLVLFIISMILNESHVGLYFILCGRIDPMSVPISELEILVPEFRVHWFRCLTLYDIEIYVSWPLVMARHSC